MADMLQQLHKQNVAVDFIERLLAAFRRDEQAPVQDTFDQDVSSPLPLLSTSPPPQPLVEPLTNRELEILELLVKRLQNKEIADQLFISAQTVKTHLKNIFGKLDVSNRREAVERARGLSLLSDR
jgi:LuxR family maltose regulon positive regulatory protein